MGTTPPERPNSRTRFRKRGFTSARQQTGYLVLDWVEHEKGQEIRVLVRGPFDDLEDSIVGEAKVAPEAVKGLSFDATCSLAVTDANGDPVVVTKGEQLGQIAVRTRPRQTLDQQTHRSPSVVPDMNGTSQMTSIVFAFIPITTPLTDSGTPPES